MQVHIGKDGGVDMARLESTYILKLPPTKNWRGILLDVRENMGIEKDDIEDEIAKEEDWES